MKQIIILTIAGITALLAGACTNSSTDGGYGGGDGYNSGDGSGQGGSMARFTLRGDFLYTVDETTLRVFDVSIPDKPHRLPSKDQYLQAGAETIFTLDTLLFIGSQNGMYIYSIANPEYPAHLSTTLHIKSCDPVVASGTHAYVTLNSVSAWCGRSSNLLQVYDISDPSRPVLLTELPLYNPRGLGIFGNDLFICDNGVKVFDITNPGNPRWYDDLDHIREISPIDAYDVIPLPTSLLVTGEDGLYQFDHTGERLAFISKITVKKE
jgi:hypothetical protein